MERTFIMVKPDGVQRGLVGMILQRIEEKGFKIVAMKLAQMPEEKAKEHYAEHVGKKFYQDLVDFITSGPSVSLVVEGRGAIAAMRKMNGATNPVDAVPGTIRGDWGIETGTECGARLRLPGISISRDRSSLRSLRAG